MTELDQLKQQLSDHPDHKLLRQGGVIPNDLRWEPIVKKSMTYFVEGEKCGVVCKYDFYNFEDAKLTSTDTRRCTFPEMMSEQEAIDSFVDEGWSEKVIANFETTEITKILKRLS